ncbi:MAG: gluconate 2-dehydrogenase subunit 3 family protein [Bacteroidales bacterium]
MDIKSISRRNFIKMSAAGAGCLCLTGCYNLPASYHYILTAGEAELLDALADQIIPPDDFSGGKDAGVTNYIDRQLAGFYSEHTDMYRKCLSALNSTFLEIYGKEFTEADFDKQREYLMDIEGGKYNDRDWHGYTASSFFGTLRNHCLQGYYGSPRHGGNNNYVSYRMMKLDYPLIIGRNVH